MKNRYLLIIMTAAAMFIALPALTQNLVLNGDLELWDNPQSPTDWTKAENISQAASPVHSGTWSAAHTSSSGGTQDFQQDVGGIVGGVNYTISYYYLDNVTNAKTRIWAYWLDGTSTLPDHADELRPGTYSSNNPEWQHYSVSLTAPAGANGFRFEVRVYHEDNNTGGMVYYDDFSIEAEGIAPEPTNYPEDFTAVASGITMDLSWADATGDQLPNGYLVLASTEDNIVAPVDGVPVANDTDLSDGSGALNVGYGLESCSFGNLEGNTPYYFMIFPYTNGAADIDYKTDGTAPAAMATTDDINIVLYQDFDDGFGTWQTVNITGTQEWIIDPQYGVGGTPCAKMSGYEGGSNINEDWLISPAMDLEEFAVATLTFMTAMNYAGPPLEVLVSNDYDGVNPPAASWDALGGTLSGGGFLWTASGNVDLTTYIGPSVHIAFKYTSTASESSTWEVDNVMVIAGGLQAEPSNYPEDFEAASLGAAIKLSWTDATGEQLPNAYIVIGSDSDNISPPADGVPIADDPDLSDGTAALNIAYGTEECVFSGLPNNTTYYFTIYPYTNAGVNIDYKNDGEAPEANATTADISVIEAQDFENGWGNWDRISIAGQQEWEIDPIHGVDGSACAKMSGYDGQAYANEDWLISPPMNFDGYTSEVLSFQTATNYNGPALEVLISTDYDGADPLSANWTTLNWQMSPGGWAWTPSGEIDVSMYEGEAVYVAYKFTSTDQESATWEVDEILLTGVEVVGIDEANGFSADMRIFPNPAKEKVYITTDTEEMIRVKLYSVFGTETGKEFSFSGSASIALTGLPKGIYLLHFLDTKGQASVRKLMVE
jgi:hypothetical protein